MSDEKLFGELLTSLISFKAEELLKKVSQLNYKILTIESMTGGSIINELSNIPGYSNYIYGGIMVYNNQAKNELLGCIPKTVYSLEYAKKMCSDALMLYSADIVISITGNANPTNEELNDMSSKFYMGFGIKDKNNDVTIIAKKITLNHPILYLQNKGRRKIVKKMAVRKALSFANKIL